MKHLKPSVPNQTHTKISITQPRLLSKASLHVMFIVHCQITSDINLKIRSILKLFWTSQPKWKQKNQSQLFTWRPRLALYNFQSWSHLKGEVTLPPRLQFDWSLYLIYWAAVKFISGTSANWVVDKQAITCFGLLWILRTLKQDIHTYNYNKKGIIMSSNPF